MPIDWTKFKAMDDEMTDGSWPTKGEALAEGDSIEGRYVSKNEKVGKHESNVYVLETQDGKKIGVWGSTVLDSKFEHIAIGSMVAIEYAGEEKGKSGSTYKNFKVGVGMDYVGDGKAGE